MSDSIPASVTAEAIVDPQAPQLVGLMRRRLRLADAFRTPGAIVGIVLSCFFLAVAVLADVIASSDPFGFAGPALSAPSALYPLGTDDLGRDLFSGVVHGIRTSVMVAAGVVMLALPVGLLLGSVAGARGGWIDDLVMRFSEIWQVLPRFFLVLMVIALFGPGLDRVVLVLGLTSWALLARIARAEAMTIRERDFVEAARALGASETRILVRHIVPHGLPAVIVYVALLVAQVMLIEASLGFLGLGDPNAISLGYLAAQAQRFLRIAWWMWFFPGVALIGLVIGLNLLADGLSDRIRSGG
ncbi:MAG: ABC transporter permease [Chloroflexota bacterium]